MRGVVPYSEKQQTLEPNVWESLQFLNPNCPTARIAAKTMRTIVSRLLQIDETGRKIDINDFEFLIYDNDNPNAGFMSAHKTKNHKYGS